MRLGHYGFLPGDLSQVADPVLDDLGILYRLPEPHIHHDFQETWNLHDVCVPAFLLEGGYDFLPVKFFQTYRHIIYPTIRYNVDKIAPCFRLATHVSRPGPAHCTVRT